MLEHEDALDARGAGPAMNGYLRTTLVALGLGLPILGVVTGGVVYERAWLAGVSPMSSLAAPPPERPKEAAVEVRVPHREPLVLTDTERAKGYWECVLPDPGPGIYAPMHSIPMGNIVVPRAGAHTEDFGYDVVVHFHGFPSVKKTLSQTAQGVVVAGFDLGNGTGAYVDSLSPLAFEKIKEGIVAALKKDSGDPRAHIRHLALSAWSAGFAAVNTVLRGGDAGVDAVVLLDGFHTAYLHPNQPDDPASLDTAGIAPLLAFAERAKNGEKIFFFSHSSVKTDGYASTTKLAKLVASRLHVDMQTAKPTDDPLGLLEYVDTKGFHMRGFGGQNEKAHCDQLREVAEAVRDILEPAWGTPPADKAPR